MAQKANTKFNPKSKEDWDEFNKANKAFAERLKVNLQTYHYLSDIEFKNKISSNGIEDLKKLLTSMRSERNFYKKVLTEPYYTEHPEKKKTPRYEDSLLKYNSINSKGKIVLELINQ